MSALCSAQEWPEAVVPWTPLGKLTLNENIKNFHNEVLPAARESVPGGAGALCMRCRGLCWRSMCLTVSCQASALSGLHPVAGLLPTLRHVLMRCCKRPVMF